MKILVKYLVNGIIAIPLLLWFTDAGFWEVTVVSLALSTAAYVIGELMILPNTSNIVATLADFGLTYIFLACVGIITEWTLTYMEIFWVSMAIAIVEFWYHKYYARRSKAV